MADDLTRKMGSDGGEANRVRIAGPSARGIVAKLEHRIVADLAEANQVVSNPQAAQPVEIEQPSDDQTPQPLTRISLQTKERTVAMKTRSRDCRLLVAIVRLDEAFCAPLTQSVPSQRRPPLQIFLAPRRFGKFTIPSLLKFSLTPRVGSRKTSVVGSLACAMQKSGLPIAERDGSWVRPAIFTPNRHAENVAPRRSTRVPVSSG